VFDENLKTRLLLILGILSVILLFTSINSCNSARVQESKRRNEVEQRLDSEEKADSSLKQLNAVQEQLKTAGAKEQEVLQELDTAKKALLQEQMVNQSLKGEIEKLSKLKEALEEDLKEALFKSGKTSVRTKK
jgi:biopolymer transport protein ExbB/TolQ